MTTSVVFLLIHSLYSNSIIVVVTDYAVKHLLYNTITNDK